MSPSCSSRTIINNKRRTANKKRTSLNRSALGSAFTNPLIFPFTIHSETITNRFSVIVTPNRGSTFGWRRAFHVTTSPQNLYKWHVSSLICATSREHRRPTLLICSKLPFEYILNAFAATSWPLYLPFHTSANPPRHSGFSIGL